MKIPIFQVDAFTDHAFGGNPAAVCVLEQPLSADLMQSIAAENNLAETAFVLKTDGEFYIRWFTPTVEVDLCGHATLAAAHVFFQHLNFESDTILFDSKSGLLSVRKENELLVLNFPSDEIQEIGLPTNMLGVFDPDPSQCFRGKTDYLFVFDTEDQISSMNPDLAKLARLNSRGVIVTAKGNDVDFVSRFFAPQSGINEDPVTGSAHTSLVPFWAGVLDKTVLHAKQLSSRGGELWCELKDNRVEIGGNAVSFLSGSIEIAD